MVTIQAMEANGCDLAEVQSPGSSVAVASTGYPKTDSMESMTQSEQPRARHLDTELSLTDAVWGLACSVGEGIYDAIAWFFNGLFSFLQSLGVERSLGREEAVDTLTAEIQKWKYNCAPPFLKYPNSTTFAIKVTASEKDNISELISHKMVIDSEATGTQALHPLMDQALQRATTFVNAKNATKIEMFIISQFNPRKPAPGVDVVDLFYVDRVSTASGGDSGTSSYSAIPLKIVFDKNPIFKIVAANPAELFEPFVE